MRQPCRFCPERGMDFGGCRCKAYTLTSEAANADLVCALSPNHRVANHAVERAQSVQVTPVRTLVFRERKPSRDLLSC